jgi:photosystem II stability/assembly factor-like uncharacterized protein
MDGWAVGGGFTIRASSVILHTADGGRSWRPQRPGTDADLGPVTFANASRGWIVATHYKEPEAGADIFLGTSILSTTNGGSTWRH